ncbi:MAG: bifunctional phosphoribosylaminoimidazolecarboxamide formyltransferase/IMP cyclohydrolase [Armatimonadetes bacterium]|nr:bifunctional phosphoribosylaminoimidazolecarboxamide formyltransferase/IMP cyclohydrolase [Armatimonadota bacterium]MCA1996839.1 bifunctional phosphoribosylaminoimidazolecarboxamide formyltransferase/IMP cyclohydrolase [Armatimonadota bacterium]
MNQPLALLSVTDKTGLVEFAKGLAELGFELLSTGGTARAIREAGLPVTEVADLTGFPEMLDGRVKTLHPKVHGGLLADLRLEQHRRQLEEAGIRPISVAAINLYRFEETVTGPHSPEQAIESIDIGGPAMIRAAAKNHANVAVVVDPSDYPAVLEALRENGMEGLRRRLAAKAFRHTAFYDSLVSRYLSAEGEPFPETLTLGARLSRRLRYGENPHQAAALYVDPLAAPGIAQARQLWGAEISYNNLLDADAAWELVTDLPRGSVAIIKHGNPCGAAFHADPGEAYRLARASDPVSAFGGIAACHGPLTVAAAEAMCEKGNFLEVVVAERVEEEALAVFRARSGWGQNVRILEAPAPPDKPELRTRAIRGGWLVQETDEEPAADWRVVTNKQPTEEQMAALRFQWTVVRHVKSNAIVVGTADRLLGVGTGQMNRVQSVRLALEQAGQAASGAVLASDAFFPFPDSVKTAAEAGIAAIVQPGGSKKDSEVIAAADDLGIAMVFTGVRHFRH